MECLLVEAIEVFGLVPELHIQLLLLQLEIEKLLVRLVNLPSVPREVRLWFTGQ